MSLSAWSLTDSVSGIAGSPEKQRFSRRPAVDEPGQNVLRVFAAREESADLTWSFIVFLWVDWMLTVCGGYFFSLR
jgi:hypothetical protein